MDRTDQLTVIVPVFNAREAVAACLESLARHTDTGRVVIVDDASTDPAVPGMLDDWCRSGQGREFRQQAENLGFVETVNRAILATDGDVVILNSDTVVTDGWLESIAECLVSDKTIATATPWSNNGEMDRSFFFLSFWVGKLIIVNAIGPKEITR